MQGAIARRSNGSILTFDTLEEQGPDFVALKALQALCDRVDGATFKAGGGHVSAFPASEQQSIFTWDETEIRAFLHLSEDEKSDFVSAHESTFTGISAIYRTV
jgi:hypothetical protein